MPKYAVGNLQMRRTPQFGVIEFSLPLKDCAEAEEEQLVGLFSLKVEIGRKPGPRVVEESANLVLLRSGITIGPFEESIRKALVHEPIILEVANILIAEHEKEKTAAPFDEDATITLVKFPAAKTDAERAMFAEGIKSLADPSALPVWKRD